MGTNSEVLTPEIEFGDENSHIWIVEAHRLQTFEYSYILKDYDILPESLGKLKRDVQREFSSF